MTRSRDEQAARWDMSKICSELVLIFDLVRGRRHTVTAQALAEEIVSRCALDMGPYEWSSEKPQIQIILREGFEFQFRWNEPAKRVTLHLQWLQTGSYNFASLRRYIGDSSEACEKALRTGGWQWPAPRKLIQAL